MTNHTNSKNDKNFYIIFILLLIFTIFPFIIFKDSLYVITSPSMRPKLNVGDLIVRVHKDPAEIRASKDSGDILIIKGPEYYYKKGFNPIFWNNLSKTPIIHRAIQKEMINKTWYFVTQGDNNLIPDGAYKFLNNSEDYILIEYNRSNIIKIPEWEILGVVAFKIPLVGYCNIFFPIIFVITISIIIMITIFKLLGYKLILIKSEKA